MNALGYGGLAFVDRPWRGFVCSAVGGAGFGSGQVLTLTLVPAEQRAASTALKTVAGNFGLGHQRDSCGLHRRRHPSSPPSVPGPLPLRRSHVRRLRAGCARLDPELGLADPPAASEGAQVFRAVARDAGSCSPSIAGNSRSRLIGGGLLLLPPFAVAHILSGPVRSVHRLHQHLLHRRSAGLRDTAGRARNLGRTHASPPPAPYWRGRPARGTCCATLTHSTLAATTVLAGAAIVIAVAGVCSNSWCSAPLTAEPRPHAPRPLHVALPAQLHGRRGLGPRSAACCSERHPTPSGGAAPYRVGTDRGRFLRFGGDRIPRPRSIDDIVRGSCIGARNRRARGRKSVLVPTYQRRVGIRNSEE